MELWDRDSAAARRLAALGVVIPLLGIYALSGPRTLPEADAGELAAVAVRGGIAHPPGYPLLILLLQAFVPLRVLVGLVPALTLFAMLCGCGAALLVFGALRARGAPLFEAWVATLVVFLSCNVWRAATSFEPFSLNLLLAAALIVSCQRLARHGDAGLHAKRWSFAIGVLFGLGFCNHHSLAMLAPLALAVMLAPPAAFLARAMWSVAGFLCGLVPLSGFALGRTQRGWIWGDWSDFFSRLPLHVFRSEYGTTTLAAHQDGSLAFGPMRMLGTLPHVLSYVFFVLLLLGVASGLRRGPELGSRLRSRAFDLGLGASFLTSAIVFPALFRLQGTALDRLITDRFLALPLLILAFPLAAALSFGSAHALRRRRPWLVSLLALHLVVQWDGAERVSHRFFERHVRNLFDIVPANAVLMTVGDGGFAGGLYGRYVLGHSDVVIVLSGLGGWYQRRLQAEMASHAPRPLYLLDVPEAAQQPPVEPIGPLLRVLAPSEPVPDPVATFLRNQALFARLRLPSQDEITRMDAFELDELGSYARTWQMIADRLRAPEQRALRDQALRYRDAFTPQ